MSRKLTFAVIFALAMCVLIVPAASTTFAAESPSTEYYNVQYNFSYEETVMPTNQIVRKYEKPETSLFSRNSTSNSVTKTKAILASLGMENDTIENLSVSDLDKYANSKSIVSTTSYTKTTPEGVSTYVTKEEAENGSRSYDPPTYEDIGDDGGGGGAPIDRWVEEETDSYMKLTLVVSHWEGDLYGYSSEARWLTMPHFLERYWDSVAVSMDESTTIRNTSTGRISYKKINYDNGIQTSMNVIESSLDEDDLIFCTTDGWEGYAYAFNLPDDTYAHNPDDILELIPVTLYEDLTVRVYVEAEITHDQLETTFNAMATYSHSTINFDLNVELIGVGFQGISGGIYLSADFEPVNRSAILPEPIDYIP